MPKTLQGLARAVLDQIQERGGSEGTGQWLVLNPSAAVELAGVGLEIAGRAISAASAGLAHGTRSRVLCSVCGASVSNELRGEVIVRAWVCCPECVTKEADRVADKVAVEVEERVDQALLDAGTPRAGDWERGEGGAA